MSTVRGNFCPGSCMLAKQSDNDKRGFTLELMDGPLRPIRMQMDSE